MKNSIGGFVSSLCFGSLVITAIPMDGGRFLGMAAPQRALPVLVPINVVTPPIVILSNDSPATGISILHRILDVRWRGRT